MTKKRIILVGQAASGKDYARKILEEVLGLKYGTSYTTRPPRVGEINGKDYYFVNVEFFKEKIQHNEWYEYVIFNDWYYGTLNSQFYGDCKVFIMTPIGLSHIKPKDREESLVIFFNIPEEIRRLRMKQRQGNADSVERRITADAKDFANFLNYDIKIDNPDYTIEDIVEIVRANMSTKIIQVVNHG
jgi:guanylate kinase